MSTLPPMVNHWWWRPGWAVGRRFYAWHLTFEGAEDLVRMSREYRESLSLPALDVIPERWLHLTMQGLGFVGEVSETDAESIADAAGRRLARLAPFEIHLGPVVVDPEVVRLQVTPAEPVIQVRAEIRAAIGDVWGADAVPEDADDFTPHVSLAYSNGPGDMQTVLDAARRITPEPARVTITHADLIELDRDEQEYRWVTRRAVPLTARR